MVSNNLTQWSGYTMTQVSPIEIDASRINLIPRLLVDKSLKMRLIQDRMGAFCQGESTWGIL